MNSLLDNFRVHREKENYNAVEESISGDVVFKGTKLWILVFAIFIASLGLNVNSTAVIIGAMLVSPLMGPIMGLGMGMAINDLMLIRKALSNYVFAAGVGLATSTFYFLLTPISDAHSEILARTSPNIYDVLIAFFGGLAGILATSTKHKGNVIPGVAIATALMPPLCTAGYGLATLKFNFFFGAFYLFFINSVFIALATLITARLLKFPLKLLPERKEEIKTRRIVWAVVLVTLLPSIYFGYDIVRKNKFTQQVNLFIENEAVFPNNYLLQKNIDPKERAITLIYGGELITNEHIEALRNRLPKYDLKNVSLQIRQGFSYLEEHKDNTQTTLLNRALAGKDSLINELSKQLDSLQIEKKLGQQVCSELVSLHQDLQVCIVQKATVAINAPGSETWIVELRSKIKFKQDDKKVIQDWLKVRLNTTDLIIHFEE